MNDRDETPPGQRATADDLARHARRVADAEREEARRSIEATGVARLWHARTGLRLLTDVAALDAFLAETRTPVSRRRW